MSPFLDCRVSNDGTMITIEGMRTPVRVHSTTQRHSRPYKDDYSLWRQNHQRCVMEKIVVLPIDSDYAVERDEAALIEEAQMNPPAFDQLYKRYLARVYRYLRTRSESDEDAADLTQQVFLQAFHALPGYQRRGLPFAAWLFQIARHVVTDSYRRRRATLSWDALPVTFETEAEQDPEHITLQQERLARLRMLLAKLDVGKRELLALRFAAGLSSPQIATVLGKSPAAIKRQLSRIIANLKEQYHEQ